MPKVILLSQGFITIVDDEDYESLSQHKWYAHRSKHGGGWYAVRKIRSADGSKQITVRMHRVISGTERSRYTDHINGDALDNRRGNLRPATNAQNQRNRSRRVTSTSPYKGVTYHKGIKKWQAALGANKRSHYLGIFATAEEAAHAYDTAAIAAYGEFARPNFPSGGVR
jgi:hypothetical protein